MSHQAMLLADAAQARRQAGGAVRAAAPCGDTTRLDVRLPSQVRIEQNVEKDGQSYHLVEGYASITERSYEMWDAFGPYREIVARGAFDTTLGASPLVSFRVNHDGIPMATTRNGRLELWADESGWGDRAWLNPKRDDVNDAIIAMQDQDLTEQSFMFEIRDGGWNDDMTVYRIAQVDLDRGDVGPVTYGANPHTTVAARSGEILAAMPDLPPLAAREALRLLEARHDLAADKAAMPTPRGSSLRIRQEQLALDRARR